MTEHRLSDGDIEDLIAELEEKLPLIDPGPAWNRMSLCKIALRQLLEERQWRKLTEEEPPKDLPFLVWIRGFRDPLGHGVPDTYDIWEYAPAEHKPELLYESWKEDGHLPAGLYPEVWWRELDTPPQDGVD